MIMTKGFTGRFNAAITQFTVELQPRIISQMFDSSAVAQQTDATPPKLNVTSSQKQEFAALGVRML